MAGDWIPMRLDLYEDPAVLFMADKLKVREEVVVGYLHKVWSWASRQCHAGSVTNVTLLSLGRATNVAGFPELMRDAGWLVEGIDENGVPFIEFPNWENWLSQSAKKRLGDTKRQQKLRKNRGNSGGEECHANVTKMSRSERDKIVTTGEESTGEKNKEKQTKETGSAKASPSDRVLFSLPTKDSDLWGMTESWWGEQRGAFPRLESARAVRGELEKMRAWLEANPERKKTRRGMGKFVNSWLTRAEERMPQLNEQSQPAVTISQMRAERIAREIAAGIRKPKEADHVA